MPAATMHCRHLQRNPDNQLYPLFEYFENWCQVKRSCGFNPRAKRLVR